MKKRLLALLLAGLITASMASCGNTSKRNEDNTGSKTENSQSIDNTQTDPPVTVTWDEVDEYVYVTADNVTLTSVENGKTVKASLMDKLHRVKVSSSRSIVEKDGVQYYVSGQYLTTDDLTGENFTACTAKTMYANAAVRVRKYASTADLSETIKRLEVNDTVTVVATGTVGDIAWSKIKSTDSNNNTVYYFVSSKYLSDKKVVDPDTVDYSQYFTECNVTMYVVVESSLNLRKNASTSSSAIGYLYPDDEVTVIATGTVDGITWSKLKIADKVAEGDAQTYTYGYVNSRYLSSVKGGTILTVDDMLKLYPVFGKLETPQTLYVSTDSLNVRSSPEFPEGDENVVAGLKKKDEVKVVATATLDETRWAMIEYAEGVYYFVGASKLTTDPEGNASPLTLDELVDKYDFTAYETAKTYYAKGKVNCRTIPDNTVTVSKELAAGDAVTVYAYGETPDGAEWFIIQVEGSTVYYFAAADLFTEAQG